ncbi:efflux RND transporter periplasmic adaptor subunit [Sulfurovum sp. ST-21]|uniref:Efflux RND transporter periplasmic adaptor subunit n=1 Tax=Sulfurovum indicum TaxID=2779528 RepID=A0A7M1S1C7_9BACT|nr:efflux RND transporter periplasmic adaptor subunit [Sulfurovum indicum]QOR61275.1 efflux RND transporter periplasmic adaptor subunit [Sulfurovum indicum]
MSRHFFLILSFLLLFSSSLFSFFEDNGKEIAKTLQYPKQKHYVKVSVINPKLANIPISQTVTGITELHRKITVNTLSEGILHVKSFNGQLIKKDDIIATVSNAQRKNTITMLKSNIGLLHKQVLAQKSKFKSAKEMMQLGILSKNRLLDQQNLLEETNIALNKAKRELGKLELQESSSLVKAPVDGYVDSLIPDGSYVAYGQTLCRIIDTHVQIRLFVPPLFAKELYIGQKVKLKEQGSVTDAKIVAILPQSSDNLLNVIALPSQTLPIGMHIEAQIQTAQTRGWIVPKDAVVIVQNHPAVYIIKKNKATLHFITVEKDMIDKVLLTDHLQAEDHIVFKNAYMLHDGAIVEVLK